MKSKRREFNLVLHITHFRLKRQFYFLKYLPASREKYNVLGLSDEFPLERWEWMVELVEYFHALESEQMVTSSEHMEPKLPM